MSGIAEKLKELRAEKNMTLRDMAKLLNISHVSYLRWEQGATEPNIQNIRKLCKIFDVTSDYLLGLEGEGGEKLY
jgi:transcriptional regulator with XRE-family HTH domain